MRTANKQNTPTSVQAAAGAAAPKASAGGGSAQRSSGKSSSRPNYSSQLQSLLDIWHVLAVYATPEKPLTSGDISKIMAKLSPKKPEKTQEKRDINSKKAEDSPVDTGLRPSDKTIKRMLPGVVNVLNTIFPHTVVRTTGKPAILHTYTYENDLHVVLEDPTGDPLWKGNMTAVLVESPLNPIKQQVLSRDIPKFMDDYVTKKELYEDDKSKEYPPISLAGVVKVSRFGGKTDYIPASEWRDLPENTEKGKHADYHYYLDSILSPAEWRILSDLILVYPHISEQQTQKYLSVLHRLAPGVRNWSRQRYAPKSSQAVQLKHIRVLDEAIEKSNKVRLRYGKYQLGFQPDTGLWTPQLQPKAENDGLMTVEPYAMMWSNGYYYLVCKKENGEMRNLRLDRIINVNPLSDAFEKDPNFDPYAYRDRSPVMYPGEPTLIRLKCRTDRISTLMDFFGTAIAEYTAPKDGCTTVTLKASEKGVRLFALQYADDVEVLAPQSLRNEVANTLKTAANKYQ